MKKQTSHKGYDGIFATRFRKLMKETKTTQESLAKHTGMARQTVAQYMEGAVLPNIDKLSQICIYFDVPSDYFLGFTDSRKTDLPDQHIQKVTGLSDNAVEMLHNLHHGYTNPKNLFATPDNFSIALVNYTLTNDLFMKNIREQILKYYSAKHQDATSLESDVSKYLLSKPLERLIDDFYNDYALSSLFNDNSSN